MIFCQNFDRPKNVFFCHGEVHQYHATINHYFIIFLHIFHFSCVVVEVGEMMKNSFDMQQALVTKCVNERFEEIKNKEEPMTALSDELYGYHYFLLFCIDFE